MQNLRNFIQKRPLIIGLILLIAILILQFNVHISVSEDPIVNSALKEIIFACIALFFIYLIAGSQEIAFSTKGFGYALLKSWWLLFILFLLGLFLLIAQLFHSKMSGNFFLILLLTILDSMSTGVCEESLMRGLLFNSLLSKEGGSKRGIYISIVISSLVFGFIHIAPDFFTSFPNISFSAASQMIGKTLESGCMGFLLAAIYLKTQNIWSIALIHGLNDFFLMLPGYLFENTTTGEYVSSPGGDQYGLVYYAMVILAIPYLITAVRIVNSVKLPQYGFFKEKWYPKKVREK